jgi:hypothetical protein
MRLREGETVSALAPVVEAEEQPNGDESDQNGQNGQNGQIVGPEGAVLDRAEASDDEASDDDE